MTSSQAPPLRTESSHGGSAVAAQMAERRERILETARELIASAGIEALTMRELARRSRVTVPTLYNLIGGRDRVVLEAVRVRTARFVAGIAAVPGDDPIGGVLSVADSCTRELLGAPQYYRSLLVWIFTADGAREVRREVGAALTRELRLALTSCAQAGALGPWADERAIAERMSAHLGVASLQWAQGEIDAATFRALGRFETALVLRAIVEEPHLQQALDRVARDAQQVLVQRRRSGTRADRPRASRAGAGRTGGSA